MAPLTSLRNVLHLPLLGHRGPAALHSAGSDTTSLKLRRAVLQGALVGQMSLAALDGLTVLFFLMAGMGCSKSCEAQDYGFGEDHCGGTKT